MIPDFSTDGILICIVNKLGWMSWTFKDKMLRLYLYFEVRNDSLPFDLSIFVDALYKKLGFKKIFLDLITNIRWICFYILH